MEFVAGNTPGLILETVSSGILISKCEFEVLAAASGGAPILPRNATKRSI
jgi:hypothetical protein